MEYPMTDKKPNILQRFYAYAYTRPLAWLAVRYLVVPALAAYTIVREHIPDLIVEMKAEWQALEQDRRAELDAANSAGHTG